MRVGLAGASPTRVQRRDSAAAIFDGNRLSRRHAVEDARGTGTKVGESYRDQHVVHVVCGREARYGPHPAPDFEHLTGGGAFDVISQVAPQLTDADRVHLLDP
jgi:hypothetical protein